MSKLRRSLPLAAAALCVTSLLNLRPNVALESSKQQPSQIIPPSSHTLIKNTPMPPAPRFERGGYKLCAASGEVKVSLDEYERIDDVLSKQEKFKGFLANHALHDTLAGKDKVEKYEIYKKKQGEEILAVVVFGKALNGHPKVVHGGITALVFDNSFGWLFLCLEKPLAVTANLSINYRSPLAANTTCVLKAKIDRIEGRKMFMSAILEDTKGKLIAESTTLFLSISMPWYVKYIPKPVISFVQSWF